MEGGGEERRQRGNNTLKRVSEIMKQSHILHLIFFFLPSVHSLLFSCLYFSYEVKMYRLPHLLYRVFGN